MSEQLPPNSIPQNYDLQPHASGLVVAALRTNHSYTEHPQHPAYPVKTRGIVYTQTELGGKPFTIAERLEPGGAITGQSQADPEGAEKTPFKHGVIVKYAPDEHGMVQRAMEYTQSGDVMDWSLLQPDQRAVMQDVEDNEYFIKAGRCYNLTQSELAGEPLSCAVEDLGISTLGEAQPVLGDTMPGLKKVVLELETTHNDGGGALGEERGPDEFRAAEDALRKLTSEPEPDSGPDDGPTPPDDQAGTAEPEHEPEEEPTTEEVVATIEKYARFLQDRTYVPTVEEYAEMLEADQYLRMNHRAHGQNVINYSVNGSTGEVRMRAFTARTFRDGIRMSNWLLSPEDAGRAEYALYTEPDDVHRVSRLQGTRRREDYDLLTYPEFSRIDNSRRRGALHPNLVLNPYKRYVAERMALNDELQRAIEASGAWVIVPEEATSRAIRTFSEAVDRDSAKRASFLDLLLQLITYERKKSR